MNIRDKKILEYCEELRSASPTPGGGAAAALTGAQGAALIMMVAELTIGKEKYAEFEEICKAVRAYTSPIYMNFIMMADQDREAYDKVVAARKLPKETEEEIAVRDAAIEQATELATKVSLNIMDLAYGAIKEINKAAGCSNPNVASDLVIAFYNVKAALYGGWTNLKVNLPSIKNEKMRELFTENAEIFIEKFDAVEKELAEKLEMINQKPRDPMFAGFNLQ